MQPVFGGFLPWARGKVIPVTVLGVARAGSCGVSSGGGPGGPARGSSGSFPPPGPAPLVYFQVRIGESEIDIMAKRCDICGKGPAVGRNVSHAHNVTRRRFEANIQRVKAVIDGGVKRIRVCTRCIRSNRIVKAA
jgi:large subunit ribosomal protein L28